MKIDIEETKRVAELYGVETIPIEKDIRDGLSYGGKVVIHYIPPYANRFSLGDNLIRTTGYLENFNCSQVFIKNETGCLEIINVQLIVNMKQIKEWLNDENIKICN